MSAPTEISIPFSCACKRITGTIHPPPHTLPLPLTLCHCTTCRHQSGLLCNSYADLPKGAEIKFGAQPGSSSSSPSSSSSSYSSSLAMYKSSENVFRTFCSECGANIYFEDRKVGIKAICTGVLEGVEGVLGGLESHIFVSSTGDGGLRDWIPDVDAWMGFTNESEKVGHGWKGHGVTASAESVRELQAYCHCKGVRFKITRPDESSARLVAPRGDIVGPPTTNEDGSGNDDAAWWLRDNGTKYLGGTCACDECRLASGFDIQTWAFVPKANMKQLDGKPLDFHIGTLKRYDSSEGVYREFCSKCGATVFWHSDSRPDLIDVSVGLLDAEEGARAESWLGWKTERVSYEEEAQNKDLIARLSIGLKRWGEMRFPSSAKKHDLGNEQTKSDLKKPESGGSV